MDRQGPVATVRRAVDEFARAHCAAAEQWCVALSGGADSLALTAVAARLRPTTALIVDHGLRPESGAVADAARDRALALGCTGARVLRVEVGTTGGPEAAARTARYRALDSARDDRPVLVAHTLDDQAETVLLGLGRGSGPRSIAGMSPWRRPWGRPLLELRRADTEAACREAGISYWSDPHNVDEAFTRVRLRREVLPLLEDVLGGGVAAALARTASLLAEDLAALDYLAARVLAEVWQHGGAIDLDALAGHPVALRRRALRAWADAVGAKALTADHLLRLDSLATGDRRSGAVRLPGALDAVRTGSVLRAVPAG